MHDVAMPFLDDRQRELVLDLFLGRVSEADFHAGFPIARGREKDTALSVLRRALEARDPDDAECGLSLMGWCGLDADFVAVLCALAEADWHPWHEDAVSALEELRDPRSAEVLYRVALSQYPYRDYDEFDTLGCRCAWALAKIRTPASVARLGDLLGCGRVFIAAKARKRLTEFAAQPPDDAVPELARRILEAHPL